MPRDSEPGSNTIKKPSLGSLIASWNRYSWHFILNIEASNKDKLELQLKTLLDHWYRQSGIPEPQLPWNRPSAVNRIHSFTSSFSRVKSTHVYS